MYAVWQRISTGLIISTQLNSVLCVITIWKLKQQHCHASWGLGKNFGLVNRMVPGDVKAAYICEICACCFAHRTGTSRR